MQVVALVDAEVARRGLSLPDGTFGRRLRLMRGRQRCSLIAADQLLTAIGRPDLFHLLDVADE